ncbi:hypothetical protein MVEN_01603300 [Mycena venus]|uniref:Uncharacterized protein n=1 Tax=Mycena venus TaxID=2733690 RepID=A0A8H6XQU8_9AGAR|nr:hypothetical protein MVEN_01603300 [Mycena venus]
MFRTTALFLLSASFFTLTSAAPAIITCSPPAASNISIGVLNLIDNGGTSLGPMELGLQGESMTVSWVSPVPSGTWTLLKTGAEFIIQHTQVPGKFLTAASNLSSVGLADGPAEAQSWGITCTTCPSNGLANDCTFENDQTSAADVCISNARLVETGSEVFAVTCGAADVTTSFHIDYHV